MSSTMQLKGSVMFRTVLAAAVVAVAISAVPAMAQLQQDAMPAAEDRPQTKLRTLAISRLDVAESVMTTAQAAGKTQSLSRMRDIMEGQILERLQNTQKFKVMARSDLKQLMEEQGVHLTANKVGASHLVVLSLTDFEDSSETINVAGMGSRQVRRVRVLPVLKIYDSIRNDALVIASLPIEADAAVITGANVQRDGTGNDAILATVARAAAERLANRVTDVLFAPKVLTRNGNEVTINRGDSSSITPGQMWQVRGPDVSEEDPDTGEKINVPGPLLGTVKVTEVQPRVSMAQVLDEVNIGQIAKGASLSLAQNQSERVVRITVDENLRVTYKHEQAPAAPGAQEQGQAQVAQAPTGMLSVGVFRFKVPQAISASVTKTGRKDTLDKMLAQLDTQLTYRLQQSGKYNLVAQSDLDDVVDQKKIQLTGDFDPAQAAAVFKSKGAKYIVVTTLDDFVDSLDITRLQGRNQSVIARTINASAVAKLINVETGELVEVMAAKRSISPNPITVDGIVGDNPQLTDESVMGMADMLATELASAVSSSMYSVTVIDRTENQITINLGQPLVQPGQLWIVGGTPKIKKDPGTGKSIRIPGVMLGRISITEVTKDAAVGTVVDERTPGAIAEGCVLRPAPAAQSPAAPGAPAQ